ncbi:uncharacterized protein PHALS_01505 [Plasmopara halstedii]|uniref:Uncharacterized protein n=1 Tax=Plasmopara halstedii TaxID=4781 RepID=A0A0P1ASY1_PLAHL|nr:uncharacterized protein PHALS_01505 [Plasmopara halstedii]CEG45190.1 hypothetical protein PHALS_01505 [Plasmopara halstedii]|eukprot:XP_024581559.1 hypothetical protein PHALS_01505 [Plasmopara halstedii]
MTDAWARASKESVLAVVSHLVPERVSGVLTSNYVEEDVVGASLDDAQSWDQEAAATSRHREVSRIDYLNSKHPSAPGEDMHFCAVEKSNPDFVLGKNEA